MGLTPVKFETDIDCCKLFVTGISGLPLERINPNVGDHVRVYNDLAFEFDMVVISRRWTMVNGSAPTLTCRLGLIGMSISDTESLLRLRGFQV